MLYSFVVCSCQMKVVLKVDKVMVERSEDCGGNITFPLHKDKLLSVLKHYVCMYVCMYVCLCEEETVVQS